MRSIRAEAGKVCSPDSRCVLQKGRATGPPVARMPHFNPIEIAQRKLGIQDIGDISRPARRQATGSVVPVKISFKMCAISTHYTHSISFLIFPAPLHLQKAEAFGPHMRRFSCCHCLSHSHFPPAPVSRVETQPNPTSDVGGNVGILCVPGILWLRLLLLHLHLPQHSPHFPSFSATRVLKFLARNTCRPAFGGVRFTLSCHFPAAQGERVN